MTATVSEFVDLYLPELNVGLLSKIVTWAFADHKKIDDIVSQFPGWGNWEQESWSKEVRNGVCQTSYCIAGQAVVQSGYAISVEFEPETEVVLDASTGNYNYVPTGRKISNSEFCYPAHKNGKDSKGRQKYKRVGDDVPIENTARDVLGLTSFESTTLFSGENGINDVIYIATIIAASRGLELDVSRKIKNIAKRFCDENWYLPCRDYQMGMFNHNSYLNNVVATLGNRKN